MEMIGKAIVIGLVAIAALAIFLVVVGNIFSIVGEEKPDRYGAWEWSL